MLDGEVEAEDAEQLALADQHLLLELPQILRVGVCRHPRERTERTHRDAATPSTQAHEGP